MNDVCRADPFGGLDPVQALLAIEEIRRLRARYFEVLDAKDWPGYVSLFTDDAILDFHEEVEHQVRDPQERAALPADAFVFHGAQAAADQFSVTLAQVVTVHHGHDLQVTLTGPDTATGICAMWDCLDYGHETFQGYGHYREEYRRAGGRWLIAQLRLTRIRTAWHPVDRPWQRTARSAPGSRVP